MKPNLSEVEKLIKQEENGLIFKRTYKYIEALECFDAVLDVATDSKAHMQWRIEAETAEKCLALTHLTNNGILQKLEEMRLERLSKNSAKVKTKCLISGRCPKCTLSMPCKHYESTEQLFSHGKLFSKQEWF